MKQQCALLLIAGIKSINHQAQLDRAVFIEAYAIQHRLWGKGLRPALLPAIHQTVNDDTLPCPLTPSLLFCIQFLCLSSFLLDSYQYLLHVLLHSMNFPGFQYFFYTIYHLRNTIPCSLWVVTSFFFMLHLIVILFSLPFSSTHLHLLCDIPGGLLLCSKSMSIIGGRSTY